MLIHARELEACDLRARDGSIGSFKDLYFDERAWAVRYLAVSTGPLLHRHQVLLSPKAVRRVFLPESAIELELSKEQVRNSPPSTAEHSPSREHEVELHQHYGWAPYWAGSASPFPVREDRSGPAGGAFAPIGTPAGEPPLRGARELRAYTLEAEDGDLGHVHDVLVNEVDWTVGYIVVDTGHWLPGRKVFLPTSEVTEFHSPARRLRSKLDRKRIEQCPALAASDFVSADDEQRLSEFYGKSTAHRL